VSLLGALRSLICGMESEKVKNHWYRTTKMDVLLYCTRTRKVKPVWIEMTQGTMGFWDAVASAAPYANSLHLASDR